MNEEIVDAEFEEIPEREVILTSALSEEDRNKIAESEMAEISPEEAAAFAAELEAAQNDVSTLQAEPPMSQNDMMRALNNAMKEGMLSKARKHRLMQQMGISQSIFTKKSDTKSAKTKKRKVQKTARRKNRK